MIVLHILITLLTLLNKKLINISLHSHLLICLSYKKTVGIFVFSHPNMRNIKAVFASCLCSAVDSLLEQSPQFVTHWNLSCLVYHEVLRPH